MTNLSPELRLALQTAGEAPLRLVDPETQQTYILVKEDVFDRVQRLLDVENNPEAFYPLLADISPEDWEDRSAYPS